MNEQQIEQSFIAKLTRLKCEYRPDITARAAMAQNFRVKFDALNRVRLPAKYKHAHCSGKPLPSFNAAAMLRKSAHLHKYIFVVDCKDLDCGFAVQHRLRRFPARRERGRGREISGLTAYEW